MCCLVYFLIFCYGIGRQLLKIAFFFFFCSTLKNDDGNKKFYMLYLYDIVIFICYTCTILLFLFYIYNILREMFLRDGFYFYMLFYMLYLYDIVIVILYLQYFERNVFEKRILFLYIIFKIF